MRIKKTFKLTLTLLATLSITTGCSRGNVVGTAPMPEAPQVSALNVSNQQQEEFESFDSYEEPQQEEVVMAVPNSLSNTFKVDQDFFNQWMSKGVAAFGGKVFFAASDTSGVLKKGTVIELDSTSGKGWRTFGSKYLGFRHPIKHTIEGITVSSGTILAVDSAGAVYQIGKARDIKSSEEFGGKDIAAGGANVYVSTVSGTVIKTNASLSGNTPLQGVMVTGGIGSDIMGNFFGVSNNSIIKYSGGEVQPIIGNLKEPIDVAVDNTNGDIYVIDGNLLKRFTKEGKHISITNTKVQNAHSIFVDEVGKVYISDTAKDFKSSSIHIYDKGPAPIKVPSSVGSYNQPSPSSYGNSTGYGNSGSYSNYSNSGNISSNSQPNRFASSQSNTYSTYNSNTNSRFSN